MSKSYVGPVFPTWQEASDFCDAALIEGGDEFRIRQVLFNPPPNSAQAAVDAFYNNLFFEQQQGRDLTQF